MGIWARRLEWWHYLNGDVVMRRTALVSVVALAVGCGSDPQTSRLAEGEPVVLILSLGKEKQAFERASVLTKRAKTIAESEVVDVPAGTRAIVLTDTDSNTADERTRWVQIKIDEGEKAGTVGEAMRGWLRPAK